MAKVFVRKNLRIAVAESCTGGLISSRLTDVSGSSAYIHQNFTTYANEAKIELLGVKPETIEKYGVVSEEVALEMAGGLIKKYDCDIALATTGIAGPLGATENKSTGLVYIGIADKITKKAYKFQANSYLYRRNMKYAFSNKALDYLKEFLDKYYY